MNRPKRPVLPFKHDPPRRRTTPSNFKVWTGVEPEPEQPAELQLYPMPPIDPSITLQANIERMTEASRRRNPKPELSERYHVDQAWTHYRFCRMSPGYQAACARAVAAWPPGD